MGLTGLVLKNIAAITGPFGYTFKGLHKELQKGHQPTHFIRKARIIEGSRDLKRLSEEERKKTQEVVEHGWYVVQQVWELMEEKTTSGLKGRLKFMKERKTWRANGAFENVEMAEKALEASRRGENLEGVFKEQRKEMERSEMARRNVVDEMGKQSGDGGEVKDAHKGNREEMGANENNENSVKGGRDETKQRPASG